MLARTLPLALLLAPPLRAQTTELASVPVPGLVGAGAAATAALSGDGLHVTFEAVREGGAPSRDVFLRDLANGTTTWVSRPMIAGSTGIGGGAASPSFDGRLVAFHAVGEGLLALDANGSNYDVFVHDVLAGTTELVARTPAGLQSAGATTAPSLSADGRFVAFLSSGGDLALDDSNGWPDVYVTDRAAGTTTRASLTSTGGQLDRGSREPRIAAGGRFVVFASDALVLGNVVGVFNVFVRDLASGATELVSVTTSGGNATATCEHPALSADGRFVVFESAAQGLDPTAPTAGGTNVFLRDRVAGTTRIVSRTSSGGLILGLHRTPELSADGRWIAFRSFSVGLIQRDTNAAPDIFVVDRFTGLCERVSVGPAGEQGAGSSLFPSISADGRRIAFESQVAFVAGDASTDLDVYVRDRGPLGPSVYCAEAPTNGAGCAVLGHVAGTPSALQGSGCVLTAVSLPLASPGLFVYGLDGRARLPFHGGLLCVDGALSRAGPVTTFGPPGVACAGGLAFDVNDWIAHGPDARLVPGVQVWAQFLARDPTRTPPDDVLTSPAFQFAIGP